MRGQSGSTKKHAKHCASENARKRDQTDYNGTHEQPSPHASYGHCAMLYNPEQDMAPTSPASATLTGQFPVLTKIGSSQLVIILNPAVPAGVIPDCRADSDLCGRSAVVLHILTMTQLFALRRLVFLNAPDEAGTLPDSRCDFKRVRPQCSMPARFGDTEMLSQCF